jgi:hypothetical protein
MTAHATTTLQYDIQQTTPTKANPAGVYVYHNNEDGVSLAVQLEQDGTVTGALAVCSPRDNFSKRKAQLILRNRLRARKVDRKLGLTFSLGTYQGTEFKNDVFIPLLKFVRDNAYLFLIRNDGAVARGNQRQLLRNLSGELSEIRAFPDSHLG